MQGPEIIYIDSLVSIVQSIKSKFPAYQYLILTDEHICKIHLPPFQAEMKANNLKFFTYILPSGELNKSNDSIVKVHDFMFTNHFNRLDTVISLGGGLITDFGGFVSSIYMRGVAFINVPTTLLGMVDASIGSKTAINTKFGKNLVGAFYDSKAIYINVNLLKTLDDRNFCNGFGEIIKAALLFDKDLFQQLENCNVRDLKDKNQKELEGIIRRSIDIKLFFVLKDKKESHLRKLLNLGHTIGHGVEYALHEELLHGECLGIGMMKMIEIGIRKHLIEEEVGFEMTQRLRAVLDKFHLPYKVPSQINLKHVISNMMSDKKNEAQEIRFVFVKDIGVYHEKSFPIEIPLIMEVLSNKIHPCSCVLPPENIAIEPDTVGSKSITNRLILMGSLGEGVIEIDNYLQAEDTEVLLEALKKIELCQIIDSKKKKLTIKGTAGAFKEINKEIVIDIANSGLSARFLTALLTFTPGVFILTGNEYMKQRPIGDLITALKSNTECEYIYIEKEGCLPIKIINNNKKYGLKGGDIILNSTLSSQYVSAILLCAPYANSAVTIHLENLQENQEITSEPYIEMTLKLMNTFGIEAKKVSFNSYFIPNGKYVNPSKFTVEPDFTALTNDLIFVSLMGGSIRLKHIGKSPLQKDANFPSEVLSKLGVEVTTCPNEDILVKRDLKKELIPININMNKYTDCSIALAIIASQINGVSTITGISNQRLKECNRIKTVCQNLIKCGVFCHEISDGLVIYGKCIKRMDANQVQKKKVMIQTNNDHRIAMAFTMLAVYFEHINHPIKLIIDDKNCVSKSYPEYFLHLQKTYGMKFQGEFVWDEKKEDFESDGAVQKNYFNQNYLILIGMRGVGKSSTARLIERKFGWKNYDLDEIILNRFNETHPTVDSLKGRVEKLGWKAFREVEKQVFNEYMKKIVEKELNNCVICCGGGIVEDDSNYELLSMMDSVVWVESTDINELEESVNLDEMSPKYQNESFIEVYNKRKQKFKNVARYIICRPGVKEVDEIDREHYYHNVEKQKVFQLNHIIENNNYKFILQENTYFLCLSLEVTDRLKKEDFFYIRNNYSALEITISDFVVNNLKGNTKNPTGKALLNLVEALRHKIARAVYHLVNSEIIITLRTEGRNFEMSNQVYNYILNELNISFFNLIFDCEYRANNLNFLNSFAVRNENIILSKHFFDATISEDDIMKEFEKMYAFAEYNHKSVKLFKMVLSSPCSNSFIDDVRKKASSLPMPNLTFKLGLEGRYSRLEAKVYLPVCESKFMNGVIEGQLQKVDVQNLRRELYLDGVLTKKFYIIGDNVNNSLSPKIHNNLFQKAGLVDHFYDFRNVQKEEDLEKILNEKDFIGASIGIPYKKAIIKNLDFLIGEAKEIGVVNTVVKCQRKFYGFNTDWYGIFHTFDEKIKELGWTHLKKQDSKKYILILGAGATAETLYYVFSKIMNFEVLILSRNDNRFGNFEIKGLKKNHLFSNILDLEKFYFEEVLASKSEILCVVNAIPNDGPIPLVQKINENILKKIFNEKCIVFDIVCYQKENKFLKFVKSLGVVHVLYGKTMLLYQAKLQFQIFTQKEYSYNTLLRNIKY